MSMIKVATARIKNIYDCSNSQAVSNFKTRFASTLDRYAKDVDAAKTVVAIQPHFLYACTSAMHGDFPANDNGDFFLWTELLKLKQEGMRTYETWIGKNLLENHNPKEVRGSIIDVFPIQSEKSLDMLFRVDERINPNLASGLRNGSILDVSMGVQVNHSYCSICNNLAYDESQWCDELNPKKLNLKGRRYNGSRYPDKVGEIVYEDNRGLEGVELSIISFGAGADPKAKIREILAAKNAIKLSNYQK